MCGKVRDSLAIARATATSPAGAESRQVPAARTTPRGPKQGQLRPPQPEGSHARPAPAPMTCTPPRTAVATRRSQWRTVASKCEDLKPHNAGPISGRAGTVPALEPQEAYPPARSTVEAQRRSAFGGQRFVRPRLDWVSPFLQTTPTRARTRATSSRGQATGGSIQTPTRKCSRPRETPRRAVNR